MKLIENVNLSFANIWETAEWEGGNRMAEQQPQISAEEMAEYAKKMVADAFRQEKQKEICAPGKKVERMLLMRDGVRLRTVFQFPAIDGAESLPTILMRSCYPFMEPYLEQQAIEYCKRGFLFIVQWCRGTGGSEGEWVPNVNERNDGLDTLAYLQEQGYVGNIGYLGDSYLALTGWCMADAVPSKVKTMYLGVYGCDRHTSAYKDGLFRQDILTAWAMENAGTAVEAPYLESCAYRPQVEADEKLWGVRLDWYRDWITHSDRDDAYWQEGFWGMLGKIPSKVKIPLFIREGWYDHHLGSAIVTYERLSEEAKAHSVLQIGPWNHSFLPAVTGQPLEHLKTDKIDTALDWFTRILKEGELPEKAAYTYVIGADEWKKWDTFPVRQRKEQCFMPQNGGQLAEAADAQVNATDEKETDVSLRESGKETNVRKEAEPDNTKCFVYDPEHPVISHGAESLFHTQEDVGSLLQPEPGSRDDVISFLSGPLSEDMEIEGKIRVHLFVSSDAEDTAFSAKLMEVFENGEAVNIRGSITTLAYRNGADHRGSYTPGEIVDINIEMWDVAWKLRKGSRLRLDISSSDFPQYSVHSNYPGIWAEQSETKVAQQTVYFGKNYPSKVILPVVEKQNEI